MNDCQALSFSFTAYISGRKIRPVYLHSRTVYFPAINTRAALRGEAGPDFSPRITKSIITKPTKSITSFAHGNPVSSARGRNSVPSPFPAFHHLPFQIVNRETG